MYWDMNNLDKISATARTTSQNSFLVYSLIGILLFYVLRIEKIGCFTSSLMLLVYQSIIILVAVTFLRLDYY